jgi:nucleotide-binding universal stress UspA family protein
MPWTATGHAADQRRRPALGVLVTDVRAFSPIVVGFDGSAESVRALDWALAEAGLRNAPVDLCHVWNLPYPDGQAGRGDSDAPRAGAQAVLAEGSRHAAEHAPSVQVRAHLRFGSAAHLLVLAGRDAALLVVGGRGAGGFGNLQIGSVSAHVVRHADCPVVVVRDIAVRGADGGVHGRRIVVGIDGSAGCESAVAFAFEEAARRGATVCAVHALDRASAQTPAHSQETELKHLRQDMQDVLGGLLTPQTDKYPDLAVFVQLVHGGPAPALIEASADAALLVLGSHGHGRFATAMLGSTSHTVLHHAPCPVAVVRGER